MGDFENQGPLSPQQLAKAAGIEYSPGMTFDDFQKKLAQKQAIDALKAPAPVANVPLKDVDTNAPLPAPPTDFKKLAVANQGPILQKPVKLEGVPAVAPGGPSPVAGPPPEAGGLGLDLSKLKAIPGQFVPGHTSPIASQAQIGATMGALGAQEQAAKDLSAAQAHANETKAQEEAGLAGTREGLRMQAEAREADRQRVLQQHLDTQTQMMNDIRSTKIDPDQYFGEGWGGAFKRLGAVIAMGMGGFAAGLRGGPNMAAEIIEKGIDRNIDAQVKNLQKKQGVLAEQRGIFGQKLQQFGDERAAELSMRSDALAAAEALAQSHITDAQTDEQRAQGSAIVAQLQEKRADVDRQLNQWQPPTVAGGVSIKQQLDLLKEVQGLEKGQADIGKTRAEAQKLAAQTQGGGPKKGLPAGVIGQISAVDSAIQALDSEIALRGDSSISLADKRAASKKNLDILSLEIPHAFTGGVPTPEQSKETRENLPSVAGSLSLQNLGAPFTPDALRQLQAQKQQLMHKRAALIATSNVARDVGSVEPGEEQ
jgi:hypothetical protein